MDTIDIRGVSHAYQLTAPTDFPHVLVFIHGWMLSREYWQPLIQQLAAQYRCLSYDLRGFGQSQIPDSQLADRDTSTPCECYTPAAYAEDVNVLLQQLKIPSAWLIGHSLGGAIALWGAAHHPNCVQGVICLNSGGGIYLKEEFERFRSAGSQLVKLRPRWLAQLPLLDLAFARANVARPMSPSWGRQRLVDFVAAHPEAALRTLLDSTTEQEVHRLPRLVAQLQQPVYFITGSQDDVMLPQYVRHLASYHPLFEGYGANVMEISDCGHLAMVEQPEQVAAQIHDILVNYGTASLLGDRL